MRTLRPSPHPSRRPGAPCLLLAALLALAAGCVTGPNLRALNPDEAKIDVYADGTVHVLGEPVAMGDLSGIVERSSTGPADTILVRLHGDPTSPAFVELRRYVTDQMIRAGHYKFRFFSTPQASVATYDPRTGKSETSVSALPVRQLSGRELDAEAARMAAEIDAYAAGTYVSEAANRQPVEISQGRPEALAIAPKAVDARTGQGQAQGAKPLTQEESLRTRYLRQQRQLRVVGDLLRQRCRQRADGRGQGQRITDKIFHWITRSIL